MRLKKIYNSYVTKLSLNQSGFSMVEVLMAMGLMGITALGVMQIQQSNTDTQVRAENSLEIFQLKQSLQQNFLDQNTCKATLAGLSNLNDTTIDGEFDPLSIIALPNGIRSHRSDKDGNMVAGSQRNVFEIDQEFRGGRVKLVSFDIYKITNVGTTDPAARSIRHNIKLRVGFVRKKSQGHDDAEGSLFYTFIPLSAMVGTGVGALPGLPAVPAGQIEKCFSAEGNAVIEAMRGACLATDFDGNGPDNEFDPITMTCSPKGDEGYCLYGGSFSAAAGYLNPTTGNYSCTQGFTAVKSGHFTRASSRACGKSTCYDFTNQDQFTCLKCSGANVTGSSGGGSATGTYSAANYDGSCTDTATTATCTSGTFPYDSNGDGCDDSCADASTFGIPGVPGGGGPIP